MANKILEMKIYSIRKLLSVFLIVIAIIIYCCPSKAKVKNDKQNIQKELTEITHINLSARIVKDTNLIENLIKERSPKAIYIEQWILVEKGNENLLQKLYKIAHKHDIKLYLFVGKDSWFGRKGLVNVIAALDQYGSYIDGIILKTQPNKTNIWNDSLEFQAQVLNQMPDAYSAIYIEAKKRNKQFIVDFPFWLSDYQGPKKNFSENVCDFADKVIFLVDSLEKLEKLDIKWNDLTCQYSIDLTKHATVLSDDDVSDMYKTIKSKLIFYSNFNGFIVDSDSDVNFKNIDKELENKTIDDSNAP